MTNENLPLEPMELSATESSVEFFTSALATNNLHDVGNEEDFKKIKQNSWKVHSEQYTELLTSYVKNSKKTFMSKHIQKTWFFIISMAILSFAVICSIVIIYEVSTGSDKSIDKIVNLIPSLLTFFTPLFVIPNLIAKYLFNTKDEEHMIEVVKHIISHDDNSVNK